MAMNIKNSEIVMNESRYDYVKPKYWEKVKLCYMDTDSFIVCIIQNTFT